MLCPPKDKWSRLLLGKSFGIDFCRCLDKNSKVSLGNNTRLTIRYLLSWKSGFSWRAPNLLFWIKKDSKTAISLRTLAVYFYGGHFPGKLGIVLLFSPGKQITKTLTQGEQRGRESRLSHGRCKSIWLAVSCEFRSECAITKALSINIHSILSQNLHLKHSARVTKQETRFARYNKKYTFVLRRAWH